MVLDLSCLGSFLGSVIRRISYRPVRVSGKTIWAFVEVETEDGHHGIGEATFFRGVHDFPNVVAEFEWRLVGEPLWALSRKSLEPAEGDITGWAVLSAIEQASWDICAKTAGQPVHALLGESVRQRVALYANVNRRTVDRSPAGFADSVRKAQADGFSTFKIAPFDGLSAQCQEDWLFQAGCDRIRAAQGAIEGRGSLLVDCHWRLDLSRALTLLDLAADLNLGWIECPLPETTGTMADLRRFKALSTQAGIPVAGGEQGTSHDYFNRILGEGVYDIIMPDVKYVGGISSLLGLAAMAGAYGATFSPHNPSGPVAHLASLHAMMVTPNLALLEHQYDEDPLFWTLNAMPMPRIRDAMSDPPPLAGLGFAFGDFPARAG